MASTTESSQYEKNTYNLPKGERLRKEVKQVFHEQRSAILDVMALGDLPAQWPGWDDLELGALAVSDRMTPILTVTWDDAAKKFAPKVGLDPNEWSVINPNTEKMIEKAALAFSESMNETTSLDLDDALKQTKQALHEGIITHGESIEQLTTRINAIFDGAERWRARRIAHTETSRAMHAAQEQSAIQSRVVSGWEWLPSSGACPICLAIAARARFVKLGQPFAIVGNDPVYRTIKFPPAHPNCTCTYLQVLIDEHPPHWSSTLDQPKEEPTDAEQALMPIPLAAQPKPKPATSKPKPVAPRKPKVPMPAGPPVSDGLDVKVEMPHLKAAADKVLNIIDKIHGDGNLPKIKLEETKKAGYEGYITYSTVLNKPTGMAVNKEASFPAGTIAHEIGHFLDFSGIPIKDKVGNYRDWEKDPIFTKFIAAVDNSDAVKSLRGLEGQKIYKTTAGREYPLDAKYIKYLTSRHEIWARAYAQWLATRSQDADLLADMRDSRKHGAADPYLGKQWADDDFEPIAKEIDAIFKKLGWRK